MQAEVRVPQAPWRSALVVGLGKSGRAALKLLKHLGVPSRAYDAKAPTDSEEFEGGALFVDPVQIPDAALQGVDLVVLSPGVPPAAARARVAALAPEAEIHGELGLALSVLHARARLPELCLVTGTNGKSTITALCGHLLQAGGREVFVGGNLGVPGCALALEILTGQREVQAAVIECSSYQLETLPALPTRVAMICNISPDHLSRYSSLEDYARTKTAVFAGLGEHGLALLDAEDSWTPRLQPGPEIRVELIESPAGPHIEENSLVIGGERFDRQSLSTAGRHNAKNALFALRAALAMGVAPDDLRAGLASFVGLPHRMAHIRSVGEIAYYDDSKATNVASTLAGLRGFERPFVLIAGGRLKGDPLEPLIDLVRQEGVGLICLGEGGPTLHRLAAGRVKAELAADLPTALRLARELAKPGQAIVLSPSGSSFDQYANFTERGRHFAELVNKIQGSPGAQA